MQHSISWCALFIFTSHIVIFIYDSCSETSSRETFHRAIFIFHGFYWCIVMERVDCLEASACVRIHFTNAQRCCNAKMWSRCWECYFDDGPDVTFTRYKKFRNEEGCAECSKANVRWKLFDLIRSMADNRLNMLRGNLFAFLFSSRFHRQTNSSYSSSYSHWLQIAHIVI